MARYRVIVLSGMCERVLDASSRRERQHAHACGATESVLEPESHIRSIRNGEDIGRGGSGNQGERGGGEATARREGEPERRGFPRPPGTIVIVEKPANATCDASAQLTREHEAEITVASAA